ncbi:MAG: SBBP repeat-containing protein [Bacteroidota bacterium]|nr:SBBP repeat-containing protein [Bacteroidota bacterium]
MKRTATVLLFLLAAISVASGQNLTAFNLDATNFPTMKAKFYAFDAAGNEQHPSPSQISVAENGIQRNVTSVTCPPAAPPKALSSVLVMDVSGSMGSGFGNATNMDIAKAAATFWTNSIPLGLSECAVSSFDDHNYFNQDFTTSRKKLAKAIASLAPQNGTNYNAGFLLPVAGGLEITKLGKHQKIIIFLTDGLPNFEPQTASIIAEAQSQGCLIFSVTVGLPCPQCLKDISGQTGGAWFENISSQKQIEDVYRQILQQAQQLMPCEITWESNMTCTSGATDVQIMWSGATAQQSYNPPASSIASLPITPASLYMRSKPVGVQFDTIVTITAINSAFTVTNITSTNPSYDINPKSFSLSAGESKKLIVSYIPFDSNYTWTRFDITTYLCPQTYYASAFYPGRKPVIPTLKLTQPNGGEQLLVGSDTVITWKGIPLTDTVKLEYSTDDGSSWSLITDEATGGRYAWHVPEPESKSCLAKVSQMQSGGYGSWAKRAGGKDDDVARGIASDGVGNVYVTGSFRDTADFDGVNLVNNNPKAFPNNYFFLAKYTPDGRLDWVKHAGGKNTPALGTGGDAIALDSSGNIYVTGSFGDTVYFDQIKLTGDSGLYNFVAKYHPDGNIEWAKKEGAKYPFIEANSLSVDHLGNIFETGSFKGIASFDGVNLVCESYYDAFIAKYRPDGSIEWAKSAGSKRAGAMASGAEGQGIAVDGFGGAYVTGSFSDTVNFDGIILTTPVGDPPVAFITKYRADGSVEWAKQVGGVGGVYSTSITADPSGNILVAGYFVTAADFDGDTLTSDTAGGYDMFVAKYDSAGLLQWAKTANSDDASALAITSDILGNAYVAGDFHKYATFGATTLISTGTGSMFVAKYNPQGTVEWAKSAGSTYRDFAESAAIDPFGSLYLTGEFSEASYFGNTRLGTKGSSDVFIWKISNMIIQSDTSDAIFSIVKPVALSEDVDMGKVLVAAAKDSVIQSFVRNGGSYSFRVDSIAIIGADASQFGLVSGIPPFVVPAGGAQHVEFDFHPSSAGVKSAQIAIFTQAETLFQSITGTGVQPTLAVMGNVIDFGQVNVGSFKDTTITVALQNLGNVPVVFTGSSELGPDRTQFSLQSGGAPFTLDPGKSQSVTLRFAPKFIGRTSGRIGFEYGGNSPAILTVFGQGLGGLVSIYDDSGYAGDHKHIPMILGKVPVTSVQSEATNFSARIAYDRTVLYPSSGNVQHGARFDTVTVSGSIGGDSILANLPFTAMLGKSTSSPMNIVDFSWLDAAGEPADYDVETESGTFYLLGICPAGGTRLYDPDGLVSLAHINPNPANGIIHVEISTIESGRTQLAVMNLLGQHMATLSDGELKPGSHSFDLDTKYLSAGSYFITLTTPTVRRMEMIGVVK